MGKKMKIVIMLNALVLPLVLSACNIYEYGSGIGGESENGYQLREFLSVFGVNDLDYIIKNVLENDLLLTEIIEDDYEDNYIEPEDDYIETEIDYEDDYIEPEDDYPSIEPIEFCGAADPDNAVILSNDEALSYLALVNRCYRVAREFSPHDLRVVNVESVNAPGGFHFLRETAASAIEELFQAATAEGLFLQMSSGYRSYDLQTFIYNQAVNHRGIEVARRMIAVPGHSEHQLGLGVDLTTWEIGSGLFWDFAGTAEGVWISENAHHFGFIISYPQGREEDTGFIFEPWHIRYVGVEAATEIFNDGLILEEFLWYRYEED